MDAVTFAVDFVQWGIVRIVGRRGRTVAVAVAFAVADFAVADFANAYFAVANFAFAVAAAVAVLWLPFSPMLFPDFFSCDPSAPPSMWFSYSLVGWVVVGWVQRQVWARHVDERQHVTRLAW